VKHNVRLLLFVCLLTVAGKAMAQSSADVEAGKAFWNGPMECRFCHGTNGEGAFGPDLASRGLSVAQFKQAIRRPWGIMPAFEESQMSDKQIADVAAFLNALPKASAPGPWLYPVPESGSSGQKLFFSIGCVQCHQPAFAGPRAQLGAVGADFEYFKKLVYTHTAAYPVHADLIGLPGTPMRMGNFNPLRVPEPTLLEIFKYIQDELKFRTTIRARLATPVLGDKGTTYAVTIENGGLAGRGLTVEDVTISLNVAAGAQVLSTSGDGYQGMQRDQTGASVALWTVPKIGPQEKQNYTITLATPVDNLRGTVRWTRPLPDQQNIGAAGGGAGGRGRGRGAQPE